MDVHLYDLVDRWLSLDKLLQQYYIGVMPFGFSPDELKFVECRICWHNMGWVGGDRIFSNEVILEASDPEFFKKFKIYLIKHTKKCKIQR